MKNFFNTVKNLQFIILGLCVAAIFAIVLPIDAPVVPVIFTSFVIEFIRQWRGGKFNWINFLSCFIGGLFIQILYFI